MSQHAVDTAQRQQPVDRVDTAPAPIEAPRIDRALEEMRRDSQTDAEQYLEETEVPHGGE